MTERPNVPVLKTGVVKATVGSNPTLSANFFVQVFLISIVRNMRSFFVLSLTAIFLLIPSSNGCVMSSYNKSSIIKVDCNNIDSPSMRKLPSSIVVKAECDDYTYKSEALSKVIEMFVSEYSETFDIDPAIIWSYFHGLKIEISIIPKVVKAAYSLEGKLLMGDVPVSGLALSPKHIWVEIKTKQIWPSSLVHELVHIIIWNQNLGIHADPDHEGEQFSGWTEQHTKFIKNLNLHLLDLGI